VSPARITPTARFKTSKGEFTVELFEDDAQRTVNNFVDLAENGFFNSKPEEKKEMAIYYAVPGTVLLTGSPTNDAEGNPGWRIQDETSENKKTHTKGTLTMCLEMDPLSKNPVPNTAGSQFMICLQDMPAWNGLYTPFGKITEGQEVADKLAQGDKIESVTIVTKRNHPYRAPGRPMTPGAGGPGTLTPFSPPPGSAGAPSPTPFTPTPVTPRPAAPAPSAPAPVAPSK
jgi:peptidyl-prolyl cis-trans isomerase B (cyclophilin B)